MSFCIYNIIELTLVCLWFWLDLGHKFVDPVQPQLG